MKSLTHWIQSFANPDIKSIDPDKDAILAELKEATLDELFFWKTIFANLIRCKTCGQTLPSAEPFMAECYNYVVSLLPPPKS